MNSYLLIGRVKKCQGVFCLEGRICTTVNWPVQQERYVAALHLNQTCENPGADQLLLNCIDRDDPNSCFDIQMVTHAREAVTIPMIVSSGAGKVEHSSEAFEETGREAALAVSILHWEEVSIEAVKEHLREKKIATR